MTAMTPDSSVLSQTPVEAAGPWNGQWASASHGVPVYLPVYAGTN